MVKSKTIAITSFVLGLFIWIPLLNYIFGALSILLGIKALNNIKKHPQQYGGFGYAIAGIILGGLLIFISIIGIGMCISGQKEICRAIGLTFFKT